MRPGIHGTPATGNNHRRSNRTCELNWGRHHHHRYYCYDNNGNSASGNIRQGQSTAAVVALAPQQLAQQKAAVWATRQEKLAERETDEFAPL
ncbi:hypothetical protein HPB52_000430 [Rhipicephalus sanguineus]|uniref:Uncharacterized protein n=1 Tax=Rhipicephalus sanguineus TaxID=34632 RepID=A0A9D4PFV1_RHISA|nr:hypothetical protein HPB52_000430 [Rhipicephalus sanguineus]